MLPKPAAPATLVQEGVWDRRRRLVAGEIEQVALQLFAERGYDNVTTDDIARACNISARTFFRYFAAKRDVLLAIPRRSLVVLCDAVDQRPANEDLLASWRAAAIGVLGGDEVDLALIEQLKVLIRDSPDLVDTINGDAELTERFVRTTAARLGVDPATDLRPIIVAGPCATHSSRHWTNGPPAVPTTSRDPSGRPSTSSLASTRSVAATPPNVSPTGP